MLYENYKRRILKISEILKIIKRYRILIIAVAAVIFATTVSLVAAKGTVFSVEEIPQTYVYGQAPEASAKAFMGRISYEYSVEGSGVWTNSQPARAGSYRVRAVGKRAFGKVSYGKEQSYQILPKPIDVSVTAGSVQYGDDPVPYADLEFEDTLSCAFYNYEDIAQVSTRVTPDAASVTIRDKDGNDVTDSYLITAVAGEITFTKRAITLQFAGASAVYDGTPLTCAQYEITAGSLAFDDRITANFDSFLIGAGQTQNTASVQIDTADGIDVTAHYDIKKIAGVLTVEKRPISIQVFGAQKVYDGTPLSRGDYLISGGTPLAAGHRAEIISASSIIDAGVCDNILTIKIFEGETDVTANYALTYTAATLQVTQRQITIKTSSAQKTYDGQPLTSHDFDVTSQVKIIENHTLTLVFSGSQTAAGQSGNTLSSATVFEGNRDVTANYDIQIIEGVLSVLFRQITVLTDSAQFTYNGAPQSCAGWSVVSQTGLAGGQTAALSGTASAITNVGSAQNIMSILISDDKQIDVTANYEITYNPGTLTVVARAVLVTTADGTFTYNGQNQYNAGFDINNIVSGHQGRINGEPSYIKEIGQKDNVFAIDIFDGEVRVTDNYAIDYKYGTLKMLAAPLTIETGTNEWTYDAEQHSEQNYRIIAGSLGAGETITVFDYAYITEVIRLEGDIIGGKPNVFSIKIYDTDNKETTGNYDIAYQYGTLKINPRPITVKTATSKWEYDGESHWDNGYRIVEGNILTYRSHFVSAALADWAIYDVIRKEDGTVGSVENSMVIHIAAADLGVFYGLDVTDNYQITYINGTLTILPREIEITTNSHTWTYDGMLHSDDGYTLTGGTLADNQRTYKVAGVRMWANVIRLEGGGYDGLTNILSVYICDSSDTDTTANYDIDYEYGILTILPLQINVTTASAQFTYNGQYQSDDSFGINPNIVTGQEARAAMNVPRIKNAGAIANEFDVGIFGGQDKSVDLTYNYDITYIYGTVTVIKLQITVTTGTKDFYFTGQDQSFGYFEAPEIVTGQSARIDGGMTSLREVEIVGGNYKEYDNIFAIKIFDGTEDVSGNYIIGYEYGILRMLPMKITVTTCDGEFTYNGQDQYGGFIFTVEPDIVGGHTAKRISGQSSIKEVGTAPNIFVVGVFDASSKDVSYNYTIEYEYGTLTMLARPITIKTATNQWDYNAEEHYDDTFEEIGDGLVSGHNVTVSEYTKITDVIRLQNNAVGSSKNEFTVGIFDGAYDATHNYLILYDTGELTIIPLAITAETATNSWVYDGEVHYDMTGILWNNGMPKGHEVRVLDFFSTITDVIRLDDGSVGSKPNIHIIAMHDAEWNEVTSNYDITYIYGTLTITPRYITVTTNSNEWEYDGQEHYDDGGKVAAGKLVSGQYVRAVGAYSKIINAGSLSNVFTAGIFDGNSVDRTHNYEITTQYGTLKIIPRKITIAAESGAFEYTGNPIGCPGYEIIDGSLVAGHTVATINSGAQTDLGSSANVISEIHITFGGQDLTYNYDITLQGGTITVVLINLIVTAGSASKKYDGTELTCAEYEYDAAKLPAGHTLFAQTQGSQTEIGVGVNIIKEGSVKATVGTEDVSRYYNFILMDGELRVYNIQITIKTSDDEKEYDGYPLTCNKWELDGQLLSGHHVKIDIFGTQTDVGQSLNDFKIKIVDDDNNDVSEYYEIICKEGMLTVTEKKEDDGGESGGAIGLGGQVGRTSTGEPDDELVIFTAKSDTSGWVYFRGKSFGDYYEDGWLDAEPYLAGNINAAMLTALALQLAEKSAGKISIEWAIDALFYLMPYYALDGYATLDDTRIKNNYTLPYSFNYIPYTYSLSDTFSLKGSIYEAFEEAYYNYVLSKYLQLPQSTKTELLRIAADNNLYAKSPTVISDVVKFVKSAVQYDYFFQDYVGDIALFFFNEAKTGVCRHYATAATAMLRALGIPARYTVGYVGQMVAGETMPVTADKGHAWVEVYIKGLGWVQLEVTGAGGQNGIGGEEDDGGGSGGTMGINLDGGITRDSGDGIKPSEELAFTATSDISGTVYFRAKSFGDYSVQKGWDDAPAYMSGEYNGLQLAPASLSQAGKTASGIFIKPVNNTLPYLMPYYSVDGYYTRNDTQITTNYQIPYHFNYIPYDYKPADNLSYTGSGFDAFGSAYEEYVEKTYLQLPDSTKAVLLDVAAQKNLKASSPTVITDVADYVQTAVSYSLEFETYVGDIAEFFFTKAKTGICQHYATAATAMLRALGVPARYTVGYVDGMTARTEVEVTQGRAHAWVEVYIKGTGWVQLEVTGAGGQGGIGGGGDGDNLGDIVGGEQLDEDNKLPLTIKPVDVYKIYDGQPLIAPDEIEGFDLDSINNLQKLLDQGYYYAVKVTGSRTELGVSDSQIDGFVLYDPSGYNVTDQLRLVCMPGRVRIINDEIRIHLYTLQKYYDGTPLEYDSGDYWLEDGLPDGWRLEFELKGSLTESGIMHLSDFEDLPFTLYDKQGNDITDGYSLVFFGKPLKIERRSIEITSASAARTYNGKALTAASTWVSKGYFPGDHTYTADVSGTVTDIGSVYNTIESVKILNKDGIDVTNSFSVKYNLGILTVLDN